jgi:hypothetical protein
MLSKIGTTDPNVPSPQHPEELSTHPGEGTINPTKEIYTGYVKATFSTLKKTWPQQTVRNNNSSMRSRANLPQHIKSSLNQGSHATNTSRLGKQLFTERDARYAQTYVSSTHLGRRRGETLVFVQKSELSTPKQESLGPSSLDQGSERINTSNLPPIDSDKHSSADPSSMKLQPLLTQIPPPSNKLNPIERGSNGDSRLERSSFHIRTLSAEQLRCNEKKESSRSSDDGSCLGRGNRFERLPGKGREAFVTDVAGKAGSKNAKGLNEKNSPDLPGSGFAQTQPLTHTTLPVEAEQDPEGAESKLPVEAEQDPEAAESKLPVEAEQDPEVSKSNEKSGADLHPSGLPTPNPLGGTERRRPLAGRHRSPFPTWKAVIEQPAEKEANYTYGEITTYKSGSHPPSRFTEFFGCIFKWIKKLFCCC